MNTLIRSPSQCLNCHSSGSESSIHTRGHKETGHYQFVRFCQGYPVMFPLQGTQNLPPTAMTSTQIPQPLSRSSFLYLGEMLNCMQHYYIPPLPGGAFQFQQEWPQTSSSVTTYSLQTTEPPSRTVRSEDFLLSPKEFDKPTLPGSTGGLASCQLHNSTSRLPQCAAEDSAHSSQQPVEALQKRELRLMKNREAARECRRKKKEYVRCLEQRVALLENQNKSLIEELKALKDIYRHKVE